MGVWKRKYWFATFEMGTGRIASADVDPIGPRYYPADQIMNMTTYQHSRKLHCLAITTVCDVASHERPLLLSQPGVKEVQVKSNEDSRAFFIVS